MGVRIFLADDHELVRRGLRALLEGHGGWSVCGEASNGREAVASVAELRPDLVVMDLGMPLLNGLDATRQIVATSPRLPVLILSARESDDTVREVFAAGARGYMLKTDTGKDLITAVESLLQGRPYFSERVGDLVLKQFAGGVAGAASPAARGPALTAREREVLQLLAEGQSTKEVAATLDVSVKTAEAHRANLMKKLGVDSLGELVRYAVRNGIVEP